MTCKDIIVLVALVAVATAVNQELRHPPHNQGHHHNHHDSLPIQVDPEVAPTDTPVTEPLPVQEEIVEDDQYELEQENLIEGQLENARKIKSRQEETENEAQETENEAEETENKLQTKATWVDCNYNSLSRVSCLDCRTRIICKYPGGGKLVGCNYALKPYCNNGICSAVPSAGCA